MKRYKLWAAIAGLVLAVSIGAAVPVASAAPRSGTTLAGYKTLDICEVSPAAGDVPAVWRYSGEISVWNEGAVDTVGLAITDVLEYKTGNKWLQAAPPLSITIGAQIPAGTTLETATVFPYSFEGVARPGTIRNTANITITNHSGSLGRAFGPSPRVTYTGPAQPLPCDADTGCTYTQGYWGNKPDVVWPAPFDRDATFYLSGQTWQQVLDTPVNVSQGYYQLAHQYIAAVLNQANGASVPDGIQDTLDLATPWLTSFGPEATTANGSGGTQKTWAAVLDDYNNGLYEGGPLHCGDEV